MADDNRIAAIMLLAGGCDLQHIAKVLDITTDEVKRLVSTAVDRRPDDAPIAETEE